MTACWYRLDHLWMMSTAPVVIQCEQSPWRAGTLLGFAAENGTMPGSIRPIAIVLGDGDATLSEASIQNIRIQDERPDGDPLPRQTQEG